MGVAEGLIDGNSPFMLFLTAVSRRSIRIVLDLGDLETCECNRRLLDECLCLSKGVASSEWFSRIPPMLLKCLERREKNEHAGLAEGVHNYVGSTQEKKLIVKDKQSRAWG